MGFWRNFYGVEESSCWIFSIEKYFRVNNIVEDEEKMKVVAMAMRGCALKWWLWRIRPHTSMSWNTFTEIFFWHFKPKWRHFFMDLDEEIEEEEEADLVIEPTEVNHRQNHFIEDGEEEEDVEPDLELMKSKDETAFLEDFTVKQVPAIDGDLRVMKLYPTVKHKEIHFSFSKASPPCSEIISSVSVIIPMAKQFSNYLDFHDVVDFMIPPKPPDTDSTIKFPHSLTSFVMLKETKSPLAPLTSTKPATSMVEPNFKDWGFIHDFDLEIPPKSLDCDSKKIISSALLQIGTAPSICSIQRGSFIFMKEDMKFSNHALNPPPQPPSKPPDRSVYTEIIDFESLIPFVGEPQINDKGFHDDVDFVIPPKPPDQIFAGFLYCGESKLQRCAYNLFSIFALHLFVKLPSFILECHKLLRNYSRNLSPPSLRTLSLFRMHTENEVEVRIAFSRAECNRIFNNVWWGASGLVSFGAQNTIAIFSPKSAQILTTLPSHKIVVNCTHWLPTRLICIISYMFNSTMPSTVKRLARKYLRNPVVVITLHKGKSQELGEIIPNLSKAAGPGTMIAAMRPNIDNIDEYVRHTTARVFSVVASALVILALLPFLQDVFLSKKSWQARQTGIKIIQQIAILISCDVLPHLRSLVEIIEHGLSVENQKLRTVTALSLAALAEAAAPYDIENFDSVLKPLWKGIRKHRGKVLAAFFKEIAFIIHLMKALNASYYTKEVMLILIREFQSPNEEMKKMILKVVKQCVSTEGVEPGYISTDILPEFFRIFWVRRMALDRINYNQLVEMIVEIASKVGLLSLMSSKNINAILEHGRSIHFSHMANAHVSSPPIINKLKDAIHIFGGTMVKLVECENIVGATDHNFNIFSFLHNFSSTRSQQKNLENVEKIYVEIKDGYLHFGIDFRTLRTRFKWTRRQ